MTRVYSWVICFFLVRSTRNTVGFLVDMFGSQKILMSDEGGLGMVLFEIF